MYRVNIAPLTEGIAMNRFDSCDDERVTFRILWSELRSGVCPKYLLLRWLNLNLLFFELISFSYGCLISPTKILWDLKTHFVLVMAYLTNMYPTYYSPLQCLLFTCRLSGNLLNYREKIKDFLLYVLFINEYRRQQLTLKNQIE